MSYAMSTVGQGGTSYIAVPLWSAASATEVTGGYYVRIKFKVESLAAVNHLVGSSAATSGSLRTTTTGALLFRNNSADLITSATSLIVPGQIHTAIFRRIYTPTSSIQLELDGSIVGSTTTVTLGWLANVNQIARFSNTARSDITVYEFEVFNGASSYQAKWDDTGASGSGVNWADDTATRNLVMTNPVVVNNSWWIYYSDVEEHFGTFTAAASIARALSSEKQSLGSYTSSMLANSSWTVERSSTGGFSATCSITRSLTSSKEVSLTKPNQSLVAGKTFTQSKEAAVSKPNQSLFTGTNLTQSKQAIVAKPTQSLLAAAGFTQAKEVNVAKPTTFLNESSAFTWEIFYGVGGTFASVMQLTKTLASNKESSSTLSGSLLATGSVNSSKEIATAFNSGMQTGFSGVSSEKQTLANIYAEMVSGFSITSSKESGSYFARTMRIDDRFSGGTDEAGRPRVITYSTNVLSKRSYQTSATITRIV